MSIPKGSSLADDGRVVLDREQFAMLFDGIDQQVYCITNSHIRDLAEGLARLAPQRAVLDATGWGAVTEHDRVSVPTDALVDTVRSLVAESDEYLSDEFAVIVHGKQRSTETDEEWAGVVERARADYARELGHRAALVAMLPPGTAVVPARELPPELPAARLPQAA